MGLYPKKEGHKITEADLMNPKIGDAYTFVAIEARTNLVLCYHLGRRDFENAFAFAQKLEHATDGHFQLTTDGLKSYIEAIEQTFGANIDYAQLIKSYMSDETGNLERRYSPSDFVSAKKVTMAGNPDEEMISTSYAERQNLTMRMSMRRLTRLTNGYSKKWENFNMALALHFAYYNFCKVHQSLRVTPAMEAGVADHIWTIEELKGGHYRCNFLLGHYQIIPGLDTFLIRSIYSVFCENTAILSEKKFRRFILYAKT